jgi:hypothetical protein
MNEELWEAFQFLTVGNIEYICTDLQVRRVPGGIMYEYTKNGYEVYYVVFVPMEKGGE